MSTGTKCWHRLCKIRWAYFYHVYKKGDGDHKILFNFANGCRLFEGWRCLDYGSSGCPHIEKISVLNI